MLLEEWNLEDAKKVWWEEAREDGLEVGRQEGREVGRQEAWEECSTHKDNETAKKLLAKGSTPEFVHEITGLSLDEIAKL